MTTAKLGNGHVSASVRSHAVSRFEVSSTTLMVLCLLRSTVTLPTGWFSPVVRVNELIAVRPKGHSLCSAIYASACCRRLVTCAVPSAFTAEVDLLPEQHS